MNQPNQPALESTNFNVTIEKYTQMLTQNPEAPEIHFNLGNLYAQQEQWQKAGVVHLVNSCVEPKEFQGIKAIAEQFSELSFAVGLHPLDAHKWQPQMKEEILSLAKYIQHP